MNSQKLSQKNICLICMAEKTTLNWNEKIPEFCNMSYKDCYYKYTALQPNTSQSLPSNLCKICSDGLKNAHLLFEKAVESFNILQDALENKEEFDVEKETSKKTTNFEIKILGVCESSDLIDEEYFTDDKALEDLEDYDNVHIGNPIYKCITKETHMNENDTVEPAHTIPIAKTEPSTDILLEQELSQSSDIKTIVSSSTPKVRKMRSYLCAYCSLKVNDKTSLRIHEATHSENRKRTETCPQCGLKLYTKTALNIHMEIHTENRQKKFKCEFCDKAFYNRGALNIHRRIHLGQMVPCRLCPKEFYRQVDLDRHLLQHSAAPLKNKARSSKYTVQCQYCNKTIASTKWREHKAVHLDQPQMKCKICDKKFFARARCVQHLKRLHRKTKDEYGEFIHYYVDCNTRMSYLMIKQQEIVHPVTK